MGRHPNRLDVSHIRVREGPTLQAFKGGVLFSRPPFPHL